MFKFLAAMGLGVLTAFLAAEISMTMAGAEGPTASPTPSPTRTPYPTPHRVSGFTAPTSVPYVAPTRQPDPTPIPLPTYVVPSGRPYSPPAISQSQQQSIVLHEQAHSSGPITSTAPVRGVSSGPRILPPSTGNAGLLSTPRVRLAAWGDENDYDEGCYWSWTRWSYALCWGGWN